MVGEQVFVDMGRFMAQQIKLLSDKIDKISENSDQDIGVFYQDLTTMKNNLTVFYNEFYEKLKDTESTFNTKAATIDSALNTVSATVTVVNGLKDETTSTLTSIGSTLAAHETIVTNNQISFDALKASYTQFTVATNTSLGILENSFRVNIDSVETDLNTKIKAERDRIDSILYLSEEDKNSFKEIVDYVRAVDFVNDTSFATYVMNNDNRSQAIEDNIDTVEATAAALAQTVINNRAESLSSFTSTNSALAAERARIDAILEASDADKDSFKEVVDLINSIDIENDQNLASYIATTNATLSTHQSLIDNRYSKEQSDARFLGIGANAVSASKLQTERKITLIGDITGETVFDGTKDVVIVTSSVDAELLDGINSTQFLRSDESDTMDGNLTINGTLLVSDATTLSNGLTVDAKTLMNDSLTINNNTPTLNFTSQLASAVNMTITPSSKGLDFYKTNTPNTVMVKMYDTGLDSLYGFKWNGQSLDQRYALSNGSQALRATDALTVDNDTITIWKADGSSESVTVDDFNSWRPVQDNLTTPNAEESLSANQGVVLREMIESLSTNTNSSNDILTAALNTETTDRISADNTIQTNLDTEISRATNVENLLRSDLNTEIANRATAISDETTARTNADNILTTNLNTEIANRISGDIDTLASAKSYTDTKISDLIDASPETLDTLNELAAAIGDDPQFFTTIDNKIKDEETARISADTSLQNNINALTSDVATQLNQAAQTVSNEYLRYDTFMPFLRDVLIELTKNGMTEQDVIDLFDNLSTPL